MATVLFADLAGFTGLSESLDPEHVKNLVDRCFARLAADVTAHGGRVDKVIGDAIVALFGAPVAHEDDAERAVRTGLAMLRTVTALAAETGYDLPLRVGVNTGEVLVGAMRAGGDYTAMGDAVNVASRLQTLADPGTVVVGPLTYAATAPVVRYELLGALQTRGREAPVEAWRAVESLTAPGRRPRRPDVPLTGREDEIVVLRHAVGMAIRRSRSSVSFVLGEAGMGKSRLIEEVAGWAETEHRALVLEGRCLPYGEANPWWPLAEAVRRACGVESGDTAAETAAKVHSSVAGICELAADSTEAAQIAAGLLHLMGDEEALPDVDPLRARQEARRSLHALVSGLTARQPVVLVLSELHWADDVVLELFGYHIDRLANRSLVVLATARGELMERWQPPPGRYNLLTLHLDPLDAAATRRLASALGADCLPAGVVDTLVVRSGGNPFFLEELLTYVGEGEPGRPGGELPATLRGLVAARIDALSEAERALLEDAAVIGRSGSLVILRALAGRRGASEVEPVIDRLEERDLISIATGRWQFRSDVVREVVYGTLTKSERARRHWAVGAWLTEAGRRTGRVDEMLEPVAHHYATSAEMVMTVGPVATVPDDAVESAVAALERAASWASRRELPGSAVRLLDRAVALAPPDGPDRARLLLDRAMEWTELREVERARQDLDAAGGTGLVGSAYGARRLTVQGVVEQLEGNLDGSATTLRWAVEEWRKVGDPAGESDALRRSGLTAMLAGRAVEAETAFKEALRIAQAMGSKRDEAWAMWRLAEMSFYAGRRDETERRLGDAENAFFEAGDTGGIGWVRGLLGYLRFVEGDRETAEALALSVLEDLRDRNDKWALGMVLLLLASVHVWQGRAGRAAQEAEEAGTAFATINDRQGEMRAGGARARSLAALGRSAAARGAIDDVVRRQDVAALGNPNLGAAWLLVDLGDPEAALDIVVTGELTPFADENEILRALALLQAGRPAEALSALAAVASAAPESKVSGAGANALACLALALASCGDPSGALAAAGRVAASGPVATYRDLALAHLAVVGAHHQTGDAAAAHASMAAAMAACAGTDDVLMAAVMALAAAHLGGSGRGAESGLVAARTRLDQLGVGRGWEALIAGVLRGVAAAGL